MSGLWKYICAVGILSLLVLSVQLLRHDQRPPGPSSGPRIISLAPNLTTILYALGLDEQLVAVTSFCDDPPEAQQKTSVGDFIYPNLELILALKPDLILAEKWESSRTVERLRELDQTVVEFPSPFSIQDIYTLIDRVGRRLGKPEAAERLVVSMREKVEKVKRRGLSFKEHPTIYIENDVPTWTIGGPTFTTEAISLCGARNIFADLPQRAPRVSEEIIVQRDPDLILSFVASADEVARRPGWGDVTAVRNHMVVDDFEQRLLLRGNHRLADGMLALQDILLQRLAPVRQSNP